MLSLRDSEGRLVFDNELRHLAVLIMMSLPFAIIGAVLGLLGDGWIVINKENMYDYDF